MATRQAMARAKKAPATARPTGGKAPPGERRELILKAAAKRFAEFGFEATTVRQIADDVSILSGSLYHHFATKEEMLDDIVRDAVLERRERSRRIAALSFDAECRLVALIRDELNALTTRQEALAIVFNERKFFRRSAFFAYLMKARRETYDVWCGILEDGIGEGAFRADTDVYLTISTIMRMLNSGADWYAHEDGSPLDALADCSLETLMEFYVGFVLRAIRAPDRAAAPIPDPQIDF